MLWKSKGNGYHITLALTTVLVVYDVVGVLLLSVHLLVKALGEELVVPISSKVRRIRKYPGAGE